MLEMPFSFEVVSPMGTVSGISMCQVKEGTIRRVIPAEMDDLLWTSAYRTAWVGASNPTAVAGMIKAGLSGLIPLVGTRPAERHPALRAMVGHLAYLFGYGIGPDEKYLTMVRENAVRLGIFVS